MHTQGEVWTMTEASGSLLDLPSPLERAVPGAAALPGRTTGRGATAGRPGEGEPADVEFIGIPEWCRRVGCSLDTGYRAARRRDIPGLFRIGRLMRVNWPAFVAATSAAARLPASAAR